MPPSKSVVLGAAAFTASAALALAFLWKSQEAPRKRKVVISGGCGNLGTKLAIALLAAGEYEVVLLEHPEFANAGRVPKGAQLVLADLAKLEAPWNEALRGADAAVHFSAVNPYPNATWAESAGSMSHTFNFFLASVRHGVRRVVFTTSNHVMGGYKDLPDGQPGDVTPASPPRCGTLLRNPEDRLKSGDAVAYAAAKLAGEQMARSLAAACASSPSRAGCFGSALGPRAGSTTTFVALRVGWCQPGENLPSTLNPSGSPPQYQTKVEGTGAADAEAAADSQVDENWFKNMWLSNGDFLRYFMASLNVDVEPGSLLLLNAMSRNTGMRWSIKETEAALGVKALDDSRREA